MNRGLSQLEETVATIRYLQREIPARFSEEPGAVCWQMESSFPLEGPVSLQAQFYRVRLADSNRSVFAACGSIDGYPYRLMAVFETEEQLEAYVRGAKELLEQGLPG